MKPENVQIVGYDTIAPHAWNGVAPAAWRAPMLLHDWTACTEGTYCPRDKIRVVLVGQADAPEALLPLAIEPGFTKRHRFVGNDDGGVPVAHRNEAALSRLADGVMALRKPVSLGNYPADTAFVGAIQKAGHGRAIVVIQPRETPAAPYIDLDESWCDPGQHLKKKMASSIRRRERRLREAGEMRLAFLEPGEDEVDAVMQQVIEVESRGWKQRAGTALANDSQQQAFLRKYARAAARQGRLHVMFLYLDDRPVAMSIGEIYENGYWGHKTGFDEAFSQFGPGILLQYHLIRHLAERGIRRLDFRGQQDPFKQAWTDKAVPVVAVRIYPHTLRGLVALCSDAARIARTRLFARSGPGRP